MKTHAFALAGAALLALGACDGNKDNEGNAGAPAQSGEAQKAAGPKTIATGLTQNGRFAAAAKSAGLDQTLAGPGPYTVFVPSDQAFASAPAGTFDGKPENRGQVTGVLTNLILPGTVLAADIGRGIDQNKGKMPIRTMGGGLLTASKEGGKTVLTDASGRKATITQADQQYSNGVVHQIDGLLMPGGGPQQGGAAPAQR